MGQKKQNKDAKVEAIDSFIQKTLRHELNTDAGLVVAVIKGENVMFERAYGKRDAFRDLPATTNTPFYIASVTKSFMGLLVKILEKEGKINLDEPITKYLGSDFKFENPKLDASSISIKDLITHQSGIKNDAITWRTSYTGEGANDNELLLEIFKKSEYSTESFNYTNNGYILTGIILEKITGKSWKSLLKEKIFDKLKLNKTSASPYSDFEYDEPALGHKMEGIKTVLGKAQKQNENSHAAGGIFSSLFDMEKWLFINMHKGKYNGKQIFPIDWMKEIHEPQVTMESGFYSYKRNAYDYGWYQGTYESDKLIHCFGSFPGGSRAHISYMPGKEIGVIALTNLFPEGIFLPDVIANYIYDTLLEKDSLQENYTKTMIRYKEIIELVKEEKIIKDKKMSSLPNIVEDGNYSNPEYGTLVLFNEENMPFLKLGNLGLVKSELMHISNHTLKMLNTDFFSRNDSLDTSEISNGIIYLTLGDKKVVFKKT